MKLLASQSGRYSFKSMPRLLSTILIITFLIPSLSFASKPPPQPQENPAPIYFFSDNAGGILGITPLTDEIFIWAYAPSLSHVPDFLSQDEYTSHEYDVKTGLTYAKQRYFDTSYGRFLSEDPVFLAIGSAELGRKTQGSVFGY